MTRSSSDTPLPESSRKKTSSKTALAAREYSRAGFCAGGLTSNRDFFAKTSHVPDSVPADIQNILFDPQTSGGLLIFSHPEDADKLLATLHASGIHAAEIGMAIPQADTQAD